jgi:hypothetical protein
VTVEHSQDLVKQFKAVGVRAEHIDGSTPLEQRRAILARVDSGVTRVLCNVGIAVEGLDIPRLKCVILARPTASLTRALQMVGRIRRPWEGITARIHDHAFVLQKHGLPDQPRDYALNSKSEDPPSLSVCPVCLALYSGGACPACGAEKVVRETGPRADLATVADAERVEFSSEFGPPPELAKPAVLVAWNTPGRVIEGVFEGTEIRATPWGERKHYLLKGPKRTHSLPGTASLDRLLVKVPPQAVLRVTYTGAREIGGGKTRKEFTVGVEKPDPAPDKVRLEIK